MMLDDLEHNNYDNIIKSIDDNEEHALQILNYIAATGKMEMLDRISHMKPVSTYININMIVVALDASYFDVMIGLVKCSPKIIEDHIGTILDYDVRTCHKILTLLFSKCEKEILSQQMNLFFNETNYDIMAYTITKLDYDCLKVIVDFIVAHKLDITNIDPELYTCLFRVNKEGVTNSFNLPPILLCASYAKLPELKLLVDAGFDINVRTMLGEDVLVYAISNKTALEERYEIVKYIYDNGFIQDQFFTHTSSNSMYLLFKSSQEFNDLIMLLNSKISSMTKEQAIEKQKEISFMEQYMVISAKIIYFLLSKGFPMNGRIANGIWIFTPGHYVFTRRDNDFISLELYRLVFGACNLTIIDSFGNTVLHKLLNYNSFTSYEDIIITKKINIRQRDENGLSYLDIVGIKEPALFDAFLSILAKNYVHHTGSDNIYYDPDNTKYEDHMKEYIYEIGGTYNDLTKKHKPRAIIQIPEVVFITKPNVVSTPLEEVELFYLLEMLSLYDNVNIPFLYKKQISDNITIPNIQKPLYHNGQNNSDYYPCISNMIHPCVIIYAPYAERFSFIHPNIDLAIGNALRFKPRFVTFPISLYYGEGGHAGSLLYDSVHNTLERFEPHGPEPKDKKIDDFIKDGLLPAFEVNGITNITYITPNSYLPSPSFQIIGFDDEKHLMDPSGYCVSWCLLYLELKLLNPNIESALLVRKAIEKIMRQSSLLNYIRSYNNELNKRSEKYFNINGINSMILGLNGTPENSAYVLSNLSRKKLLEIQLNRKNNYIYR